MIKKFGAVMMFDAWIQTVDPKALVTVGFTTRPASKWVHIGGWKGYPMIAYTYRYGKSSYQVYLRDPLTNKAVRFEKPLEMKGPRSKEAIGHDVS